MLNRDTGEILGEAFYNPPRADELAVEIARLSGNVRHWINCPPP